MQTSVIVPYAGSRRMLRQQLDALEAAVAAMVSLDCEVEVVLSCNSSRDPEGVKPFETSAVRRFV